MDLIEKIGRETMKKSLFFENAKLLGEELVNLGHTKAKEFGGIIDWPYEVTK